MSGRMRRATVLAVAGMLAALMSVVVTPVAHACSCLDRKAADLVAAASVVFVGTAAERIDVGTTPGAWSFGVERVHRGDEVTGTAEIITREGTTCDLTIEAGARFLILGTRSGDRVQVAGCGGSQALGPGEVGGPAAEILDLLGPGSPPGQGLGPGTAQGQGPAEATARSEENGAGRLWPAVLMIGAGVVLAGAVLLGVRRRTH